MTKEEKKVYDCEHEKYLKEKEEFAQGQEIFNSISRQLNCMGSDFNLGAGFMNKLNCEHPTLQQQLFKEFVIPMIKFWAERYEKKWYDARSEATCKACHEIWEILKEKHFPFI